MPLFVSQSHLNARWGNAIPALGVALALCLTVAATAREGASFQSRLPGDPVRLALAVMAAVLSLPWIFVLVAVLGAWLLSRERAAHERAILRA